MGPLAGSGYGQSPCLEAVSDEGQSLGSMPYSPLNLPSE